MGGSYARSRPTPMTLHREPEPTFEEAEEALSEGDAIFRTRRPGTVLSALSHVAFRRMWIGSFASNIGTWMQTLVLGAYAYDLTGSSAFVGLLTFAQLGPLLLLGLFGGLFADLFDRRLLLIVLQIEQAIFSLVLAAIVGFGGRPVTRGPCSPACSPSASATPSTSRRGARCCRAWSGAPTSPGPSRSTPPR